MDHTPTVAEGTGKSSVPSIRLDHSMQVLFADSAAIRAGITPGEDLSVHLSEGELLRHHACCQHAPGTCFDPLGTPQNSAVFALEAGDFHGFQILYVEYVYTLRSFHAIAWLFPSLREYLLFDSEIHGHLIERRSELTDAISYLHRNYEPLFQSGAAGGAVSSEAFTSAALLSLECFQSYAYQSGEDTLRCCLRRFLSEFFPCLQSNAFFIDCTLTFTNSDTAPDTAVQLAPGKLCLLLTALCGILNDISDSRCIEVSTEDYSQHFEIRLTTEAKPLPPFLLRTQDLQALAPVVPSKALSLTVASYIVGYSGWQLNLLTRNRGRQLSFSLVLPTAPAGETFHSPAAELTALAPAFRSVEALCALLYTQQKQQDHNHVHGSVVLSAKQ